MSLLSALEKAVNRSPFYNTLRYSWLSNALVEAIIHKTQRNVAFYEQIIGQAAKDGVLVFDIGANKGNKAYVFAKMGYSVVCLEPERGALSTLHYRFDGRKNVTIVPKGVSDKPGSTTLNVFDYRSGFNTLSKKWAGELSGTENHRTGQALTPLSTYEVSLTTLDELIAEFGMPHYVKIDVEGFELQVVQGLSRPIQFLSFEANLPEFSTESLEILSTLHKLAPGAHYLLTMNEHILPGGWVEAQVASERLRSIQGTVEVFFKNQ